jgi:hypothetical protein
VITIDGTKIMANASMDQNRSYREIANEILRDAEETDRREDEQFGDRRGDELPEQLHTPKVAAPLWSRPGDGSRNARARPSTQTARPASLSRWRSTRNGR